MKIYKRTCTLDTIFFVFLNLFLVLLLHQLHLSNYRYSIINDFSLFKGILIYIIILLSNVFIYFRIKNTIIFRVNLFLQFYLFFMLTIIINSSVLPLYAPVIALVIVSFYSEKKLYYLHLISYLGIMSGSICFIIFLALTKSTIENKITSQYMLHLFLSLTLVFCITIIKLAFFRTTLRDKFIQHNTSKNTLSSNDSLEILSISAIDNDYEKNLHTLTRTMQELIYNSSYISASIDTLKNNMIVASSNSKSVTSLSSKLQKDISTISMVSKQLDTTTECIKNNILTISESFHSMLRTTLMINSAYANLMNDLDNINNNRELLENILLELENLSIVTSHLSNKTTIEASKDLNIDALNLIINEFHSYSSEIRAKIINMSSIFKNLNKSYYSCKTDIANSENLLASNRLIVADLFKYFDAINSNFNSVLLNTSTLRNLTELANNKSKNLTADSVELQNALHEFGKVSFSLSRLNKQSGVRYE